MERRLRGAVALAEPLPRRARRRGISQQSIRAGVGARRAAVAADLLRPRGGRAARDGATRAGAARPRQGRQGRLRRAAAAPLPRRQEEWARQGAAAAARPHDGRALQPLCRRVQGQEADRPLRARLRLPARVVGRVRSSRSERVRLPPRRHTARGPHRTDRSAGRRGLRRPPSPRRPAGKATERATPPLARDSLARDLSLPSAGTSTTSPHSCS
mmetsp:Transcript_6314/g.18961  ORF Transcript_6314/g.18961 Transcript_6314/m.18961 type:complete len:214 (-) Transcript_6314:737-1378(-)